MEKINTIAYKEGIMLKQLLKKVPINKIAVCILAFFISRVTLFGDIHTLSIAYYALMIKNRTTRFLGAVLSIAGILIVHQDISMIKYIIIIGVLYAVGFLLEKANVNVRETGQALFTAICAGGVGIVFAFINGFTVYLLLLALLEGIFAFIITIIYSKCFTILNSNKRRRVYSDEELISLILLIGSAIAGISNIAVYDIYVLEVISYVVVLYFGYTYGINTGALVGILLGLIINFTGNGTISYVVVLGCVGILAGLFKDLGKIGITFGFIIGTILLLFYINPNMNIMLQAKPIILSGAMFIIIPSNIVSKKTSFAPKMAVDIDENTYLHRVQDIISEKLKVFSNTFTNLADTFNNISEKRTNLSQQEISKLFDEVADRICKDCSLCSHCWENDFYYTYQTIFSILNAVENKGRIEKKDISQKFFTKCHRAEEFIKYTNRIYEIYKLNLGWENRIIDSRNLVSDQLKGISKIIQNLSNEVYREIYFDTDKEKDIYIELEKLDFDLSSVIVLKNKDEKYEVELIFNTFKKTKESLSDLVKTIGMILGRHMKISNNNYYPRGNKNFSIKLVEQKLFKVTTAIETSAMDNLSGDNYTNLEFDNGKYLIALSDGMGTGIKAHKESNATIELLEKFMEAGFDKSIALKMINSVLLLKSNEETFSTLDLGVIDLCSGVCEFVKIGGATIFIKKDDCVDVIKSTSLPVGFLNKLDMEVYNVRLNHGDTIIMVTDGVIDSGQDSKEKEQWLKDIICNIDSNNPKYISEYLLDTIRGHAEDIKDDMTILVSRLWKDPS